MPGKWIKAVEAEGLTRHLPCYDVTAAPMIQNASLSADQILCLAYAKAHNRAGLEALFQIDAYLGAVALGAREAMMARIKLAWWREQGFAPDAPTSDLTDVIAVIVDQPLVMAKLDLLVTGWDAVIGDEGSLAAYAAGRGVGLFGAAMALDGRDLFPDGAAAARGWAMADLARMTGDAEVMTQARDVLAPLAPSAFADLVRPMGVLAVLARSDARRGLAGAWRPGSPTRMARAFGFVTFNR
jgi:15-cis-phytoene synthase